MSFLFGNRKTPAERIREYNRTIKKAVRETDRERANLERQEKKLIADIKKFAKDNQLESAKVMAKDLVRTRAYIKKMLKMKSHMEAVALRLQTMQSSASMAQAMKGVTKVMGTMNRKMNLPQISKIMMEFEKQNEMMGMKEEKMSDAMDDAFADDDDEDEEENVLGSVLAELGVDVANQLGDAPKTSVTASEAAPAAQAFASGASGEANDGGGDDMDAELQKRLDNLRRT